MKRASVTNTVETHRRGLKLTQEALADRVDVTRQTIISIEKGNYVPSVLLALALAKVFHKPVEEVFHYENR
jgi:putative transcriptional regulator